MSSCPVQPEREGPFLVVTRRDPVAARAESHIERDQEPLHLRADRPREMSSCPVQPKPHSRFLSLKEEGSVVAQNESHTERDQQFQYPRTNRPSEHKYLRKLPVSHVFGQLACDLVTRPQDVPRVITWYWTNRDVCKEISKWSRHHMLALCITAGHAGAAVTRRTKPARASEPPLECRGDAPLGWKPFALESAFELVDTNQAPAPIVADARLDNLPGWSKSVQHLINCGRESDVLGLMIELIEKNPSGMNRVARRGAMIGERLDEAFAVRPAPVIGAVAHGQPGRA